MRCPLQSAQCGSLSEASFLGRHLTLRQLRCFIAVAEELHFGRAAMRLCVDQSPLSRTIRELEEELGAKLFVRTTRRTELTLAGERLVAAVPRVFRAIDQARDAVRAAVTGREGELRVGLAGSVPAARLAALMAACSQEAPQIKLLFVEVLPEDLPGRLVDGDFDVGLSQVVQPCEALLVRPAWVEGIHVVMRIGHALSMRRRVGIEDLAHLPIVLGDGQLPPVTMNSLEAELRTAAADALQLQHAKTFELLIALVASGHAVSLMNACCAKTYRCEGVVSRPVNCTPRTITTWLVRRREDASEAVARFEQHVLARRCRHPSRG
ncbi:LysR family transcriptional regulator [Chitinasiproducens palmae]|uniref:DNA-binding transcriptional regulator, LysR family n=1 Tax=Chitinasiproducens palmae TaxID=1770053 RepID=A0A1H2PWD7_9BURK|nr:LysR family transcriptional regulator [Chitinasiproducens palmae]SDV50837.1 DNA-binding transcriptional regulator, LysR family [Chitinasiproducens palmae]